MRPEEARLISRWIEELDLPKGAVCLNIGSSTGDFRRKEQPHIHNELIAPLERAGIRIVHCDMKPAAGVDEVGDLLDPAFRETLKAYDADLLICSNLLEHLVDPNGFARACGELVKPGGMGLFTVPCSYPYHPDPIDTMLRLRPDELAALLPGWDVVKAAQIEAGSLIADLKATGKPVGTFLNHVGRVLMPFYRPKKWRPLAHRLLWLGRPYRQSLVLLKKPLSAGRPLAVAPPEQTSAVG